MFNHILSAVTNETTAASSFSTTPKVFFLLLSVNFYLQYDAKSG